MKKILGLMMAVTMFSATSLFAISGADVDIGKEKKELMEQSVKFEKNLSPAEIISEIVIFFDGENPRNYNDTFNLSELDAEKKEIYYPPKDSKARMCRFWLR